MNAIAPSITNRISDPRHEARPQVRIVPNDPRDDSALGAEARLSVVAGFRDNFEASNDELVQLRRRFVLMRLTSQCIDELRGVETVRQLVELAPKMICRLGFDRAMVSKVAESTWTVERTHCDTDSVPVKTLTDEARRFPQRVDSSMLEAEMIRRRVPLLVEDAQHDPRVHRGLAVATGTRSYVAAPIMPAGKVIGFLHADRFNEGTDVDEFDREMLMYFAEQFGRLVERTILLERFEILRRTVEGMTSSLGAMAGAGCRNAVELPGREGPTRISTLNPAQFPSAPANQHPDSVLTRREVDVLELMATGYTNARIAAGLVISEGTVKSHVKHILRKLCASNRAEAVSRWLQRPAVS